MQGDSFRKQSVILQRGSYENHKIEVPPSTINIELVLFDSNTTK